MLSDISEENRTGSVREKKEDEVDMVEDGIEVGEKVVPVNSVKCHNVEIAQLDYKIVNRKTSCSTWSRSLEKEGKRRDIVCTFNTILLKI